MLGTFSFPEKALVRSILRTTNGRPYDKIRIMTFFYISPHPARRLATFPPRGKVY